MRRDIPGILQISTVLCGNPTLVESIFLRKRGGSRSTGLWDTCSSDAVVTTDWSWMLLNTRHIHMHTHIQQNTFLHTYVAFLLWFDPAWGQSEMLQSYIVKIGAAVSINLVINLSQTLKRAVIGLIVVNHVCQWCRKVQGIPLQEDGMMKQLRFSLMIAKYDVHLIPTTNKPFDQREDKRFTNSSQTETDRGHLC